MGKYHTYLQGTCSWWAIDILKPRQNGGHFVDDNLGHFLKWKFLYFTEISLKCVQQMVANYADDKFISHVTSHYQPMMATFTDAYMHRSASMSKPLYPWNQIEITPCIVIIIQLHISYSTCKSSLIGVEFSIVSQYIRNITLMTVQQHNRILILLMLERNIPALRVNTMPADATGS